MTSAPSTAIPSALFLFLFLAFVFFVVVIFRFTERVREPGGGEDALFLGDRLLPGDSAGEALHLARDALPLPRVLPAAWETATARP